jgi:hypothetical protein
VVALVTGHRTLLHVGAAALSVAFVTFAVNLFATLASAPERTLTWWALAGAGVFLLVTPAYGAALAVNVHRAGFIADRFAVVAQHAHVALVGVVLLVVVGVAHHLLPMFLLSHGGSEWGGRSAAVLLFASAATLAVPVVSPVRVTIAGAFGCLGVLAFAVQAVTFFRNRKRRAIDPGMRLAGAGVAALIAAALLAPVSLGRGLSDPRLLTTYYVVLLGGVSLFVAGHYFKIVPFLVWYHRFGPLVGRRKVPKVSELFSSRVATVDGALLVSGWLGLAVSTWVGAPLVARTSAAVFAAGALVEVFVIAQVARRRLA